MSDNYTLQGLDNLYYSPHFVNKPPKWEIACDIGMRCLSNKYFVDKPLLEEQLKKSIVRIQKRGITAKTTEDVIFIFRIENEIKSSSREALPQGTIGEGEEVII